MNATTNDQLHAQAHCVGLLNELEAVLTGWLLGEDEEEVRDALEPLHRMLDREPTATIGSRFSS